MAHVDVLDLVLTGAVSALGSVQAGRPYLWRPLPLRCFTWNNVPAVPHAKKCAVPRETGASRRRCAYGPALPTDHCPLARGPTTALSRGVGGFRTLPATLAAFGAHVRIPVPASFNAQDSSDGGSRSATQHLVRFRSVRLAGDGNQHPPARSMVRPSARGRVRGKGSRPGSVTRGRRKPGSPPHHARGCSPRSGQNRETVHWHDRQGGHWHTTGQARSGARDQARVNQHA